MANHDAEGGRNPLTGRKVLGIFIAFFAVVFAANAYLITTAISTHTGVVANEPYRKGLKYNDRIEAEERQAALGWQEETALSPDGKSITVSIRNAKGEPVSGLAVSAIIGRPATANEDAVLTLVEERPGQYSTAADLKGSGQYVASLEVRQAVGEAGEDVLYRARKRLWLKP